MINFFVTRADSGCIRDYLQGRGLPIADRMRVVEYEDLAHLTELERGGTVFAALDQTSATINAAVAVVHDQLSALDPPVAVLNDPRKALRRFDLLTRLHAVGCNRFRVVRAQDDLSGLRFPVFLRKEHSHDGSLTPILHDWRTLDRALGELVLRGVRPAELLVVEFCDTADREGVYRKYSAMRIGSAMIPRHLHVSPDWITKAQNNLGDDALVKEELAYLEDNPHERWLWQVFGTARIEYGRIDYGIYRGEPQVWEINMNPTLGRHRASAARSADDRIRRLREPGRALAHQRMLEAFTSLDAPATAGCLLPIAIDSGLQARLASKRRGGIRQHPAAVATFRAVIRHPRLRELVKTVAWTVAPLVGRATRRRLAPRAK